ncbi:putative B6 ABC transporter ATP-binding protein [Roseibium aggregatum]|uniref:ABC transporter ATP-binding protein n=1 Tax=Roseibium aggregatum TaxID=187304 RepID=A0A939J6M7_9HYPH|nr:ABC transporter ATP-binding protein [Roseibium aggregatum]MBN9673902.1 ABC transporter ATP-binding protein [Roseibium aggregatum]
MAGTSAAATALDQDGPLVSLKNVTKRFPGIVANDRISIDFWPGEVHVLLGENGAGKSTLVSMLTGFQQPSEGEIEVAGVPQDLSSPQRALDLGIGAVYQHSMLAPTLTLAENVSLGRPWWQKPDRRGIADEMRKTANSVGITIRPEALTSALSLGERQQAEIVRALMRGSRFLILDEATAMLTPKDAEKLGNLMRLIAQDGRGVVFITHKLNEAVAYGDRISVLRLGKKVGGLPPEQLRAMDKTEAHDEIVRLMFGTRTTGSEATENTPPPQHKLDETEKPILEILALEVDDEATPVSGIELKIRPGEVVGIAGIDGNGQVQLAEALAGQRPVRNGRIYLDGVSIEDKSIGGRRNLGLSYVTDDRLGEGIVGAFPVSLNLLLKQIGDAPFWKHGLEQPAEIARNATEKVAAFDIRTPGIGTPAGKLSGGNIQKLLLARELGEKTRAVIFAKPTYGLDLQNIAASRNRIREAADARKAVLLISTELDELLELSDRIAVMSQGRIVGIVDNNETARQRVGELMSGVGE